MHDYGLLLKTVREGRDMTQEQASEKVGVSVDTWYAYEANRRLPPPETVNRICDALEAPWLAMYFLEAHSGSMKVLPNVTARALPTAVLTLLSRVLDFNEKCRIKELVSVAEDGVVDEFEQDLYDEIVEELDGIIEAALAVKFPMDAKKDRSDVGASKRPCSRPKSKNDRTSYFSTSAEERQHLSRMGGATV